ncbi:MAG TPA: PEGA domain-containing protein [Patescibacteria group bacterium]|nr:PEGA domain-containing protein [Patescibacteria group bacterium]
MVYQVIIQKIVTHITLYKRLYLIFGSLFLIFIFFLLIILSTSVSNTATSTNQPQKTFASPTIASTNKTYGTLQVTAPTKTGFIFSYNNHAYSTPVTITNIPVGSYTLDVHNDGYADEKRKVTIKSDQTTTITLTLKELTLDEQIAQIEPGWSKYFDTEGEKFVQEITERGKKYPLTRVLPHVFENAMLDYDVNNNGSVTYVVRPLPGKTYTKTDYEQAVNEFIQSQKIDPKTIPLTWEE